MNFVATKKSFHLIALSSGQNASFGVNEPVLIPSNGSNLSIRQLAAAAFNSGPFDCTEGTFLIKRTIKSMEAGRNLVTYYIMTTARDQIFLDADPRSSSLRFYDFCKAHKIESAKVIIGPFTGEEPSDLSNVNVRLFLKTKPKKSSLDSNRRQAKLFYSYRGIPEISLEGGNSISIIHAIYERWRELGMDRLPNSINIAQHVFSICTICTLDNWKSFMLIPPKDVQLFMESNEGNVDLENVCVQTDVPIIEKYDQIYQLDENIDDFNLVKMARKIIVTAFDTSGKPHALQSE